MALHREPALHGDKDHARIIAAFGSSASVGGGTRGVGPLLPSRQSQIARLAIHGGFLAFFAWLIFRLWLRGRLVAHTGHERDDNIAAVNGLSDPSRLARLTCTCESKRSIADPACYTGILSNALALGSCDATPSSRSARSCIFCVCAMIPQSPDRRISCAATAPAAVSETTPACAPICAPCPSADAPPRQSGRRSEQSP